MLAPPMRPLFSALFLPKLSIGPHGHASAVTPANASYPPPVPPAPLWELETGQGVASVSCLRQFLALAQASTILNAFLDIRPINSYNNVMEANRPSG